MAVALLLDHRAECISVVHIRSQSTLDRFAKTDDASIFPERQELSRFFLWATNQVSLAGSWCIDEWWTRRCMSHSSLMGMNISAYAASEHWPWIDHIGMAWQYVSHLLSNKLADWLTDMRWPVDHRIRSNGELWVPWTGNESINCGAQSDLDQDEKIAFGHGTSSLLFRAQFAIGDREGGRTIKWNCGEKERRLNRRQSSPFQYPLQIDVFVNAQKIHSNLGKSPAVSFCCKRGESAEFILEINLKPWLMDPFVGNSTRNDHSSGRTLLFCKGSIRSGFELNDQT